MNPKRKPKKVLTKLKSFLKLIQAIFLSIYQCLADLGEMDNPVLPNPRWSPISGSYLKKNYPNERAATPLFPISTPTR